ncbi:MAG TPA: chalcone isomerase family protein, partial [Thiotrichales bacterium]|nr:chalcone isomerase family protein [Thiotrichales bacterium]
ILWLALWGMSAQASVTWKPVGEGVATWMFMDIYQAKLYRPEGVAKQTALTDDAPLKLELCYYKSLTPDIFVQGANESLPAQLSPALRAEVERLHASYQAVKPNDCYTLRYENSVTELLLNQRVLFQSKLPEFKQVYFGVWLGEKPLSDKLKATLLAN